MSQTPDLSLAIWRKSSRSGANGACVEVAAHAGVIGVRDSKNLGGAVLAFNSDEWHAFVLGVKSGSLAATL
ncbi:DUF397 domain-containing protein [Sphaerisporangium sp. NPDC049003]|uniref:DUF397 domain-containing protein n=1 Tax=Sphaerisporangium sp. NPDC049003 TaxID=3364517 RepID=UPI0037125D06